MRFFHDGVLLLMIGVTLFIGVAVLDSYSLQSRGTLAVGGFVLVTLAWIGMYFQIKRELPGHDLAKAWYVTRPNAHRVFNLVRFHFVRRGIDLWSSLLIVGLSLLVLMAFVR